MTDELRGAPSGSEGPVGGSADFLRRLLQHVSDPVPKLLLQAIAAGDLRPSDAMDHLSDFIDRHRQSSADQRSASRAVALADAALGAEGSAVIDPYARQLARWVAEGRMTGDEAVAFSTVLIDVGATLTDPDAPANPGYRAEPAPPAPDP